MPPRGSAPGTSRSFSPQTEQGDFVHVKKGDQKIEGTIVSRSDGEIVLSQRGKYGAPQLHVINTRAEDVTVAPTKTKKITYRNDTSQFIDPFRQRSLVDTSELATTRNELKFSIQGYDVRKDEVYIEGSLNGGSPFGKWVSAKDFFPLVDAGERAKVGNIDDVIRGFAGAIGQSDNLKEASQKNENPGEAETAKSQAPLTTTEPIRPTDGEVTLEIDRQESAHNATLAEQLKKASPQPFAERTSPTGPEKKAPARPGLKDTKTYVQDRLETLRGKAGHEQPTAREGGRLAFEDPVARAHRGQEERAAHASAQSGRESVVLSDSAFLSGAAVPALVLAYAAPQSDQLVSTNVAAWNTAIGQVETLTNKLNTRLNERRAQYQVLSLAGADDALLAESRDRIGALERTSVDLGQTMSAAQSRHSALELGRFQSTRINSVSHGEAPLANARGIQDTLTQLRAQQTRTGGAGAQTSTQGISAGSGVEQTFELQIGGVIGANFLAGIATEIQFEQDVQATIGKRIQELEGELQELQRQTQASLREGQELQGTLAQALADTEANLGTLRQARNAQAERVEAAERSFAQATKTLESLALQPIQAGEQRTGVTIPTPLVDRPTAGGSAPSRQTVAGASEPGKRPGITPPSLSKPTGAGGITLPGGSGKKAPTTALGGRRGIPTPIKPLGGIGAGGGAMAEFATLDRDRQRDRRRGDFGDSGPLAVTDLPQKRWNTDDEEDADEGEDETDDASFRDDVDDANQYLDQFQSGEDDGESIRSGGDNFDEAGNAFADSSSYSKRALGAMAAGEPLPPGAQAGVLGDVENFRQLASSRALMARSQALRAQSGATKKKIADAKAKRMKALEQEMVDKAEDIVELGAFEAIVPVLKYIGRVFVSAANRNAGFMALKMLPGYRPPLPQGVEKDKLEQQWDLLLTLEIFLIIFGVFASFMMTLGILLAFFFYLFGPILGVIATFCSYFGSVCHAVGQAVGG